MCTPYSTCNFIFQQSVRIFTAMLRHPLYTIIGTMFSHVCTMSTCLLSYNRYGRMMNSRNVTNFVLQNKHSLIYVVVTFRIISAHNMITLSTTVAVSMSHSFSQRNFNNQNTLEIHFEKYPNMSQSIGNLFFVILHLFYRSI